MRSLVLASAILMLAAIEGCASPTGADLRPDLPDTLGENGAVIAEIEPLTPDMWYMSATISKQTTAPLARHFNVNLRGNYISAVLSPGDYILDGVSRSSDYASGSFNGVSVTLSDHSGIRLERHFTVRAGQITNLGELVLIKNPRVKNQVVIRTVDNTPDALRFLRKHFPKLLPSAASSALTLAPGVYARDAELRKLRVFIASSRARQLTHADYVTGPAGTVARITHDASGRPVRLHLIDAGVTAGITQSTGQAAHDRFAFETVDGRLFVVHGLQAVERPTPPQVDDLFVPAVHLAGDRTVIILGQDLDLFVSSDDGLTWRNDASAKVTRSEFSESGFAEDGAGYYVYETYPARLEYSRLGDPALQAVALPPGLKEIHRMVALQSELLIEPQMMVWSDKTPYPFYVRARSGGTWQTRHMPKGSCRLANIDDITGANLRAVCFKQSYLSADGGLTWSPSAS